MVFLSLPLYKGQTITTLAEKWGKLRFPGGALLPLEMTELTIILEWYPDDAIRWFFVLLCQGLVLVQFHHIEVGYLELLGQISNFIESHWFSIHIHVSMLVEPT